MFGWFKRKHWVYEVPVIHHGQLAYTDADTVYLHVPPFYAGNAQPRWVLR